MTSAEVNSAILKVLAAKVGGAQAILLIYAMLTFRDKAFELSLQSWAEGGNMSTATAQRALIGLKADGWLIKEGEARYEEAKDGN